MGTWDLPVIYIATHLPLALCPLGSYLLGLQPLGIVRASGKSSLPCYSLYSITSAHLVVDLYIMLL